MEEQNSVKLNDLMNQINYLIKNNKGEIQTTKKRTNKFYCIKKKDLCEKLREIDGKLEKLLSVSKSRPKSSC
jgi:hypothetical protein